MYNALQSHQNAAGREGIIPRLMKRTLSAAPIGLFAALLALAAVLAVIGAAVSPAGVARAQEAEDSSDAAESETTTIEICVEDQDSGELTCREETAPAGESKPMSEGGATGQACVQDPDDPLRICKEEILVTGLPTTTLKSGDSVSFTVIGKYLEWGDSIHKLRVKKPSRDSDIGFNQDCSQASASATAVKPSQGEYYSYSHTFTLYACDATGGTVTAEILEDDRVIKTYSQDVSVRKLLPPTNLSVSIEANDDNDLDVAYTPSESPNNYQFELYRATSMNSGYTREATESASASPADFDNMTKGYWYKARGRNCRTSGGANCGDWSGFSAPILLPVVVTISSSQTSVEEGRSITFTVSASPAPKFDISVNVDVSEGRVKYISGDPPDSVSVKRNSASATFRISTRNDNEDKNNGRVTAALETGTSYTLGSPNEASVTVRDNDVSPPPTATPRPVTLRPPTNLSAGVNSMDDDKIDVTYTRSGSPHYYQFEIRKAMSSGGSYSSEDTENASRSPVSFDGLDQGYWYKARGRLCKTNRRTGCGSWSGYSSPLFLFPTLTAPSSLTLGANGDSISVRFSTPSLQTNLLDYKLTLMSIRDKTSPTQDDYSEAASTAVAASTSSGSHAFGSLGSNSGDLYKVRLSACLKSNSSSCETVESSTLRRPLPPTGLTLSVSPSDSTNIKVAYTVSESPHNYKTELHAAATSETGSYSQNGNAMNSGKTTRPTFTNKTRDRWYKARAKNCLDAARTQCGLWSAWSTTLRLKPKLAKPTRLDVSPMPLRKAKLTWMGDSNATDYVVEVRKTGGMWPSSRSSPNSHIVSATEHEVTLDEVFKSGNAPYVKLIYSDNRMETVCTDCIGFADHGAYEYRIKATNAGGTHLDSEHSEVIRIIDNPLLLPKPNANRAGGSARSKNDKIALSWAEIANVQEYRIRFRLLGKRPVSLRIDTDHTDIDWPKHQDWPYYDEDSTVTLTLAPPRSGDVSTEISPISDSNEKIYAFQINYATTADEKVFSARDAYVWLSDDFPGNASRVGTYPFFGHWTNREFEYIICETTFPDVPTTQLNESAKWRLLIENAFSQWQEATDSIVTITHDSSGRCADRSTPMAQFILNDDGKNEVRMLNPVITNIKNLTRVDDARSDIWTFPEVQSDVFKSCIMPSVIENDVGDIEVRYIPACVTSFAGYSGFTTQSAEDRERIAYLIQRYREDRINPRERIELAITIAQAARNPRQASNPLRGVDVTFSQGAFYGVTASNSGDVLSVIHGPDIPSMGVDFNTCLPDKNSSDPNPDHGYRAYEVAVHEAGHALGLSNIDYPTFSNLYEAAHPTIPDSLLNYDHEVDDYYPGASSRFSEPDCSPHPFDLMALNAVYQVVPRATITSSSIGSTEVQLSALVSGGVAPYDFRWSDSGGKLVFSPNASSSTVSATLDSGVTRRSTVTVQVVVSDKNGTEAHTEVAITVDPT